MDVAFIGRRRRDAAEFVDPDRPEGVRNREISRDGARSVRDVCAREGAVILVVGRVVEDGLEIVDVAFVVRDIGQNAAVRAGIAAPSEDAANCAATADRSPSVTAIDDPLVPPVLPVTAP
jgi:hypothetical protein